MQIITTIEPTYRIDIDANEAEGVIDLTLTSVADAASTTTLRMSPSAAYDLSGELGSDEFRLFPSDELLEVNDWELYQNSDTEIVHLSVVGSNAAPQHVQLFVTEAWALCGELFRAHAAFRKR